MPATDWRKLTPEQAKAWNSGLMRDAEHVGLGKDIAMALCIPIGIDPAAPGSDRTVVINVFNPTGEGHDRIRDRFKSAYLEAVFDNAGPFDEGHGAAMRVSTLVLEDLERRYPDSVNARCVGMGGESRYVGVLAVTWMRGREVFHRRFPIDAHYVHQGGVSQFASILLPILIRQIDATEGAERK